MAKPGPRPDGTPYEDLPQPLRDDIDRAITSAAQPSVRKIYDDFGLSQRKVSYDSFKRMAAKRRQSTETAPVASSEPQELTWELLERKAMEQISANLTVGKVKTYEVVAVIKAKFDKDRLDIERKVEGRAQVLFGQRMEEWDERKAKADAAVKAALEKKGLDLEAINRIRQLYDLDPLGDSAGGGDGQ